MGQRDARHEELLDAARRVFARFGFRKTTLEDIACAAGIAKSSIYHYFQSKEEVFSAVVAREADLMLGSLNASIGTSTRPDERLSAFVLTSVRQFRALRNLDAVTKETLSEFLPLVRAERDRLWDRNCALLAGIIRAGVEGGEFRPCDVDAVAHAIVGVMQRLCSCLLSDDSAETEESFQRFSAELACLLDLFLNGLMARSGASS